MVQYMPQKHVKWGFKVFCLCSRGYMGNFDLYQGKDEDEEKEDEKGGE